MNGRIVSSEYMHWAKTSPAARYNLALSDLAHYPLDRIPVELSGIPITGPGGYGYQPLLEAIGAAYDVPAASVVTSFGTSMANHIAMASIISPGDEVLIERPTYELIPSTAAYLGATIKRFERRFEDRFRIDVEALRRSVTSRTKLIIITNLHNPSSALTDETTLRAVGEIASGAGARVLVDEVYLDAAFSKNPRSSFHLGPQFVITNSLTKVYGLSGLRCGWIFAEPGLAEKMWRLIDLFYSSPVHIAERISVAVFSDRANVLARARTLLEANADTLQAFLASRHDIKAIPYEHGLVVLPKLSCDTDRLCNILRETYETSVVPGKFFDMPGHIRIGLGRENAIFAQGLGNLGKALDDIARGGNARG